MNHDEFDKQVREALRIEPSQEQVARLEGFWKRQLQADRRRRVRRMVAVAASVLLAATVSARLLWPERAHRAAQTNQEALVAVEPPPSEPARIVLNRRPRDSQSPSAGRAPTAYERLIFAVRTEQLVGSESRARIAAIDRVIEQVKEDATADAEALILSAGLAELDVEQVLLRRLQRPTEDNKPVILKLLAACGSARSAPALVQLARQDALRDQALATLEEVVGVVRLADVIDETSDVQVRAALFRRLLTADAEPALRGYLSWVYDKDSRAEALAVAETVSQPALGWLLALLDDRDETVRLSAALVLGYVNGPEVTESLISLVMQERAEPVVSTEAWVALLACRGQLADEFFAYAAFQPRLLAHVNRARVQWAQLIP